MTAIQADLAALQSENARLRAELERAKIAATSGPDVTGQAVEVRSIEGGAAHVPSTGCMRRFLESVTAGPFGFAPEFENMLVEFRSIADAARGKV